MKFARNKYKGGTSNCPLTSSGCRVTAMISVRSVATPRRYPTQMRGKGGNSACCNCCPRDSPSGQAIRTSIMCLGSVTAWSPVRQTICGRGRASYLQRVAPLLALCINWRSSLNGGKDDIRKETRGVDRPCCGVVRSRSRRGRAGHAQRGGAEPIRPAENGSTRGGLQIQGQRLQLRPGENH